MIQLSLFDNIEINETDDFSKVDKEVKSHIEAVMQQAKFHYKRESQQFYKIDNLVFRIYRDDDGAYLNGMDYKIEGEVFLHYIRPTEFYKRFITKELELKVEIVSKRDVGQPKLAKPKELKGIKQLLSVDYISKKAKCQVFVKDDGVWIKHVDWFSPSLELLDEDRGAPLAYLIKKYGIERKVKGFIYDDAWGDIVLRREVWLCIKSLLYHMRVSDLTESQLANKICRQIERIERFKHGDLLSTDMERFFENVIGGLQKELFKQPNLIERREKFLKEVAAAGVDITKPFTTRYEINADGGFTVVYVKKFNLTFRTN